MLELYQRPEPAELFVAIYGGVRGLMQRSLSNGPQTAMLARQCSRAATLRGAVPIHNKAIKRQ
jgi:hypothetical protein